jgi:uncharacterized membrane protein SpoIIM required for sporulation
MKNIYEIKMVWAPAPTKPQAIYASLATGAGGLALTGSWLLYMIPSLEKNEDLNWRKRFWGAFLLMVFVLIITFFVAWIGAVIIDNPANI